MGENSSWAGSSHWWVGVGRRASLSHQASDALLALFLYKGGDYLSSEDMPGPRTSWGILSPGPFPSKLAS